MRYIEGAKECSGERSGENLHPEMPSQTHPLPHLIFFFFFFRRENCVFQPALLMSDCAELC